MWPFKKKAKEPEPEPIHKILTYENKKFNIGRTLMRCTFLDGKSFNTWVYGEFSQFINWSSSYDHKDTTIPFVSKPLQAFDPAVSNSLMLAQFRLRNIGSDNITVVDDTENPTSSRNGVLVAAKIVKTEKFEKTFAVGYLK
jgi:hypothetical protein